jgi:hypothetical protein
MTNPLDEYLQEKNGGRFTEQMPNAMANAGANAVIGLGAAAAGVAATKIYQAVTKRRDFRNMMEANGDLHEEYQRDPKLFNQMFSTLRHFSPQFSSDPMVAGTYMRQMVQSPLTAGGVAIQALGAHSDIGKNRNPFVQKSLEGAAGHNPIKGLSDKA